MKRFSFTFAAAMLILSVGIGMSFLTSCEGPAGPAGQDASETCIQCHNDKVTVLAKMTQTANSLHQTGATFERSTTDCAPCHTHQGYLEVLATGAQATASDVTNPVPANCRTCHMIHENYDSTDFALRGQDPVDMWINGVTVDLGKSNVCVSCHQPRIPSPMPSLAEANADISITSNRWGPHHGPQSAMVWGTGGYEIAGSASYPQAGANATHHDAGCVTCHMADPFGAVAGGHTFNMTYDSHGPVDLIGGCQKCHSNIEDFDYHDSRAEVESLLEELRADLVADGILNDADGLVKASGSKPLVVPNKKAGALMNFYLVEEDRSMGIHNPAYVKALLQNSIEVFN